MRHKSLVILGCAAFVLALSIVPAEAQRRHRGGRVTVIRHSPLLWGGGFHTGFYRPYYFGFGQWYPYPSPVFGYPPGILSRRWRGLAAPAGDAARRGGVRRRLRRGRGRRLRWRVPAAAARARSARDRDLSSEPPHAAAEHLLQPRIDPHDPPHARSAAAGRHRGTATGAARDACVSWNAGTTGHAAERAESDRAPEGRARARSHCACSRAMRRCSSTASRGEDRRRRIGSSFSSPKGRTACASRNPDFKRSPSTSTCAPAKRPASTSVCCRE